MIRDQILEAARQANLYGIYRALNWYDEKTEDGSYAYEEWDEQLELFAKLIAAAEREACAKVCEKPIDEIQITDDCSEMVYMGGLECAAAIRARGEK